MATSIKYTVVIHPFTATKADEMELHIGEVIEVLRQADDGWWSGRKSQTIEPLKSNVVQPELWFPSNFTVIPPDVDLSRKGKPLRFLKVQFDYAAKEPDELNLKINDIVVVLDTEEDDGWLRGVLNGRIGVFPSNFGILQEKNSPSKESDQKSTVKSEIRRQSLLATKDQPMASLQSQSTTASLGKPQQSSKQATEMSVKNNATARNVTGKALVSFEYHAQQPDELTLKKGAIITLLDEEEDGWWRGVDDDGKEGVFPFNFVSLIPAATDMVKSVTNEPINEKNSAIPAKQVEPEQTVSERPAFKVPAGAIRLPFATPLTGGAAPMPTFVKSKSSDNISAGATPPPPGKDSPAVERKKEQPVSEVNSVVTSPVPVKSPAKASKPPQQRHKTKEWNETADAKTKQTADAVQPSPQLSKSSNNNSKESIDISATVQPPSQMLLKSNRSKELSSMSETLQSPSQKSFKTIHSKELIPSPQSSLKKNYSKDQVTDPQMPMAAEASSFTKSVTKEESEEQLSATVIIKNFSKDKFTISNLTNPPEKELPVPKAAVPAVDPKPAVTKPVPSVKESDKFKANGVIAPPPILTAKPEKSNVMTRSNSGPFKTAPDSPSEMNASLIKTDMTSKNIELSPGTPVEEVLSPTEAFSDGSDGAPRLKHVTRNRVASASKKRPSFRNGSRPPSIIGDPSDIETVTPVEESAKPINQNSQANGFKSSAVIPGADKQLSDVEPSIRTKNYAPELETNRPSVPGEDPYKSIKAWMMAELQKLRVEFEQELRDERKMRRALESELNELRGMLRK